jgi:hypothetical protein
MHTTTLAAARFTISHTINAAAAAAAAEKHLSHKNAIQNGAAVRVQKTAERGWKKCSACTMEKRLCADVLCEQNRLALTLVVCAPRSACALCAL